MATTIGQIKKMFYSISDEFSDAYVSNDKLSTLWSAASYVFFNDQIDKNQASFAIVENLQPIIAVDSAAVVSGYAIDLTLVGAANDYWRFRNVRPTYVSGGVTYNEYARQFLDIEKGSVFSAGSYMYPRYELVGDAILLEPQTGTCTVAKVEYYSFPIEDAFTNDASTIPYDKDICDCIVREMSNRLAIEQREGDSYQMTENEIKQNN